MRRGTIKSQKLLEELFQRDNPAVHTASAYPLRAVWMDHDESQLLVSVSKRHFHHAVDRNRIKRQVREAYRQNLSLTSEAPKAIAFIWLSDQHVSSTIVQRCVRKLLQRSSSSPSASTSVASHP